MYTITATSINGWDSTSPSGLTPKTATQINEADQWQPIKQIGIERLTLA